MQWLLDLFLGNSTAHQILLLGLTITLGLLLGRVKIFGVSLGGTFILFVGILLSELGLHLEHEVLHFFREFGLILFVFSIGLQMGPSFFSNFKAEGKKLNILAAMIVFLGAGVTIGLHYISKTPMTTMVGIMSGAITNTPGLGAAQQAYIDATGGEGSDIALGYAVAYPLGVVGIILSMILLKGIFKIRLEREEEELLSRRSEETSSLAPLSLEVTNTALFGHTVDSLSEVFQGRDFVVSRIMKKHNGQVYIADKNTVLEEGDKVFIIASEEDVKPITMLIGRAIQMDRNQWITSTAELVSRKILITKKSINGKSLGSLQLRALYGVNVTRIHRSGMEFVASPGFTLQYGDKLTAVGTEASLSSVEKKLGNSLKHLHEPNLSTIFIGIVLGIIVGSIPIALPSLPQPVKLGLAGGPLIVAILIARFGYRYRLVTYTTMSANLMMREIGITAFLACVGLSTQGKFVGTLVGGGYMWVLYGVIITLLPLLLVGIWARKKWRVNYFTLIGLISGATTDPPALAYTHSLTDTGAPSVAYATVYPLTMFLRVLVAQLMVLLFL